MKKNLTTGSVLKTMIYFLFPYFLSYFLQTLYGMADLFIIGQFNSVESTTAVSIGSQVMHMLTVMIVGLAMGTTILIGRAIGGKQRKLVSLTIGNTITLFAVTSVFLTAVLLLLTKPIVAIMSTPVEAVSDTILYLRICFIGIPFITAYNVISSIFRGMGDSKSPMYFIAVACVANIVLDYLLIGMFGLGAIGAALGTTISQTISVLISLFVIVRQKNDIEVSIKDLLPCRKTMLELLKIGLPVSLQDGFIQVAFIVITVIANKRGLNDAAAVGIVEKVIGILFLVPSSMLSTVSSLSAQNIGAGKHERVRLILRYAFIMAVSWGILAVIVMQLTAESFIGLFTGSVEVIILGSQYMRGYVWDCIFAGIHFSFSGYFCAYGLSSISFIHNFLSIICVRIPLAYFTSHVYTNTLLPMGLASPVGSMVSVIICICAFCWLNKKYKKEKV
ncbi:MAG: MATE family efflux transporter [Thomasclavelia sp.]